MRGALLVRWGLMAGGALGLLALLATMVDRPLMEAAAGWGRAGLGRLWAQGAYWAGLGGVQIAATAAWFLWGWWRERQRERAFGLAALAAVCGAGLSAQVIKHLLGRPRPGMQMDPWTYLGPSWDSDFHSFPSGHTATSFALAAVLAARWPRAGWLFYLLAAGVGAGRVLGGSHFLSDVLGGAFLGLAWGLALASLARRKAARP